MEETKELKIKRRWVVDGEDHAVISKSDEGRWLQMTLAQTLDGVERSTWLQLKEINCRGVLVASDWQEAGVAGVGREEGKISVRVMDWIL